MAGQIPEVRPAAELAIVFEHQEEAQLKISGIEARLEYVRAESGIPGHIRIAAQRL